MPCTTKSNGNVYSLRPEEQQTPTPVYASSNVYIEREVGYEPKHNVGNSGYGSSMKNWGWKKFGKFLFWLIVLTVILWLIYFSLAPSFVTKNDSDEVDPSKVLLWAFVTALIVMFVFAMICYIMGYKP